MSEVSRPIASSLGMRARLNASFQGSTSRRANAETTLNGGPFWSSPIRRARRRAPPGGREDLVVWLKHLENRSRHSTERNDPVATYDFTWMWRDLNVDHLRN